MANHKNKKQNKPPRRKRDKQAPPPESKRSYRAPLLIAAVLIPIVAVAGWLVHGKAANDKPAIPKETASQQSSPILASQTPEKPTGEIPTGGPRINFDEPSHDFGTVTEGTKVAHTFVLHNTGKEPLKLIKAAGT
jgi:hypothetical protein